MCIAIGMAVVPRGEVGRFAGLFDASGYAGLILIITYTTLAAPFWIRLYYNLYGDRLPNAVD